MDPPDYNRKFAEEHNFGYPLISNGEAVIRQFGAIAGMAEYFQGNHVPQGIAVRSTAGCMD